MLPPQEEPRIQIPPVHEVKKSRRKLSGSLLALSAAAITSIYTIGYVSTQASVDKLAAEAGVVSTDVPGQATQRTVATNASAPMSPSTSAPPSPTTAAGAGRAGSTTTTPPTATASPIPGTTAGYRDGTYVGAGTSRHGSIQATVVIQNGKIVSASISSCNTRYPCSDVASLVKSVVSQQTVPVNHVSGATDSSTAYKTAVSKALAQAKQG